MRAPRIVRSKKCDFHRLSLVTTSRFYKQPRLAAANITAKTGCTFIRRLWTLLRHSPISFQRDTPPGRDTLFPGSVALRFVNHLVFRRIPVKPLHRHTQFAFDRGIERRGASLFKTSRRHREEFSLVHHFSSRVARLRPKLREDAHTIDHTSVQGLDRREPRLFLASGLVDEVNLADNLILDRFFLQPLVFQRLERSPTIDRPMKILASASTKKQRCRPDRDGCGTITARLTPTGQILPDTNRSAST